MNTRILQLIKTLAIVLLVTSVMGCAQGSSNDDDGGGDNGGNLPQSERNFSIGVSTNRSGVASTTFQVPADTTKLAVTASVSSNRLVRFNVFGTNSVNYLNPGGAEITFADSFAPQANAAIAPSRDVDPNLVPGVTYTAEVQLDTSNADQAVTFIVNSKADGDLNSGRLRVNIFFVGEIGQDSATREVIGLALDEFRNIYGRIGIELDVRTFDISGPTILPQPFEGSNFYQTNSALSDTLSVNLFVGGDIEGSSGDILGLAGGIPGPPNASARSGVAIGIFPGAGPDGSFNTSEILILGETLAHESGHFLGIFHPVDFSGDRASATDPLNDTNTCRVFSECLSDDSLIGNLMFVSPVSDGSGGFVRQNRLSDQQRAVLNRYIAVD